MKTALILGGTGLVGKQLIRLLTADERYSKIISLVRKPSGIAHPRLEQVPFDFDNPAGSVVKADDIFCCLGTTKQKAGSKAAFYKVDHDYVLQIAAFGFTNGAERFALVSSAGADKNAFFFYPKTKGEIEAAVSEIGYEGCFIFRPSVLTGNRTEHRLGESLAISFMIRFSFLIPNKYKPVPGEKVAMAMINEMNSGKTGVHIIHSSAIAAIVL